MNPRLVRGLDYYSRTVFEWITDALGSQDAVCSGGRYDGLIAQMGGESTPAIGFAMGVERVVELVRLAGVTPPANVPDVFVMAQGDAAQRSALALAETLRDQLPGHGSRGPLRLGQVQDTVPPRGRVRRAAGADRRRRRTGPGRRGDQDPPSRSRRGRPRNSEYPVAELGARVTEYLRRST